MAVSQGFLDMIREMLVPLGSVSSRRMFGGASLYCDGTLFALVDDDVLFLKADDTTKLRYEAEGCGPFTYEGQTGPVSMQYWRLPERLYDEPDELLEYAREALGVARLGKVKTRARKSSGKTSVPRSTKQKPKTRR
jgi:DNA transformation protein